MGRSLASVIIASVDSQYDSSYSGDAILDFDDKTIRLSAMFRALGHPARVEMLRQMAELGEASCTTLSHDVDLAQSTVSEHLRVLKEAGLIEQCGPSPKSGYCAKRDALIWLKQEIVAF